MNEHENWHTTTQVADLAGVDRATVVRAINKGELAAVKDKIEVRPGMALQEWYVIEPNEAQRWIKARREKGETRGRKRQDKSITIPYAVGYQNGTYLYDQYEPLTYRELVTYIDHSGRELKFFIVGSNVPPSDGETLF